MYFPGPASSYFPSHDDDSVVSREILNPDGLIDATGIGYNQAIVENGRLYMSGQVGWDESFDLAGEDITSQTHKAFENVETLLADADKSLDDVRKVTAHVVRPHDNLAGFFEAWNELFDEQPYPCLTVLGPEQLAQEGFLVEIEVEVSMDD